ncbi:MAG: efflux RND transporter permease subunit [Bacteroidota bacterium]
MKNLIEHFVKYPILANIVIAITLLAGVVALVNTKKSFFPTRKDTRIQVAVTYLGASPEEMEEGVTLKVEESLKSIAGIDEVTSTSSENTALVSVEILENYDIDEAYTDIKNAVDAISSFPDNAEKPIIYKVRQQTTAQWLAITGDVDLKALKYYAEKVEDDLLATGKVSQVEVSGLPPLEISIEVSEETLLRYNLSFDDIVNAVRFNNRDISAGSVKSSREEILIRSKAKEADADAIGGIVVRSNYDGKNLLLRDVAVVKEQFADEPYRGYLNGKRAVFIEVKKLETEDLQVISDAVAEYVPAFNKANPAVKLEISWDFMNMLNQRLELLTSNGIIGLALVLISLGLFLNIRLSFWVAWGIPSSFLGMFIIGAFIGLTINMISLFGMILVIGILVDDGIVIAENIYTHFEKTKNPIKAAVNGTLEVMPAVITSVTTTIIAFMPLLLLTGGFEFLKDMAIVVIFSLGFSLLEAFFVLPAHLASKHVLKVKAADTRGFKVRAKINQFIDWMRYKLYGRALAWTMKYRAISVALVTAFVIIIGGLMGGGLIKSTFFPLIPFNSFNVDIAFKPGEREEKVESYLQVFNDAIWRLNGKMKEEFETEEDIITDAFSNVGFGAGESGSHVGSVTVFYSELDQYDMNQFDLIRRVREEIGPIYDAEKYSVGSEDRFGKPVSIRVMGTDYLEMRRAADALKDALGRVAELKEVEDNIAEGKREMLFDLRPEAYFLGLDHNAITRQIRQGFFGEEAQRLMKGNDELKIWIRYPKQGRESIGQLEDIKIKSVSGEEYPVAQLADYEIERSLAGIKHYDANRTITVEADMVDPFGEVPPILDYVRANIMPDLQAEFPLITFDFGGQAEESAKAEAEIGLYFGAAFIVILFILMITFRSFYQALLILMMVPLGWICAALGHGIESWINPSGSFPVSILSAWGMFALSGVIINDAVVFLAKFNSLVKDEGMTVYQAAYNAGLARFRAIMLTSLTTVAGLYPLIKESSFQAQFLIPMAISVAYGVLFGTFLILLFFPVFILIMNDIRRMWRRIWSGERSVRERVERVVLDQERLDEFGDAA